MTDPLDETQSLDLTGPPIAVELLDAQFPELEVCEFIGKGGMGAVYRARQIRLDRDVALKVLLPSASDADFHRRFQAEARAMARLNHPNVVIVHDFGRAGDLDYLVMELIRGQSLRSLMADPRVPPSKAYAITSQVCQALEYAHESGIVHRDVKPENILVESRGRVRLADFGLARLLAGPGGPADHSAVGTPGYIAPELLMRPDRADHRVDLYSVGAVIYELLTGERYRSAGQRPSECGFPDARMDRVVDRALQQDPDHRYQWAREIDHDVTLISRTEDSTLTLRRHLAAAPIEVFRAWTEAAQIERFLAPSDAMTTQVSDWNSEVGGTFRLTMHGEQPHTAWGQFCRIQPPHSLSLTWSWENEPVEPDETQITIRLTPAGGGTELQFIHERLSSRQSRDNHQQGWEGVMGRLTAAIEA